MSSVCAAPSESYTTIDVEKLDVMAGFWASQAPVGTTSAASRFATTSRFVLARGEIDEVGTWSDETEAAKVPSPLAA
jgi:hypothetical protein